MQYKNFEINVTEQLTGYGYTVANNEEGVFVETPQDNGGKVYATEAAAMAAAKGKVNQLKRHGF